MNSSMQTQQINFTPPQKYSESYLSQQWLSFCSQIKKTMSGSEEQKDRILRRRILKFFHNFSLERNRYYVNRREVIMQNLTPVQISNNSILLYGIDFLPQPKIQQYFYPFEVSIQYYDDSHCSVTFQNYENLMKAVYGRLQNNIDLNFQEFCRLLSLNQEKKLQWRQLVPYYQLCFERLLWFRFLTSSDYQNKSQPGQAAIYKTYMIVKDQFFKDIKKAKEQSQYNGTPRKRQGSSRQSSFSRSRSRQRSKERNLRRIQPLHGEKRQMRDKYSSLSSKCQLCHCHIFKEVKKFMQLVQNKSCCKHKTFKPKKIRDQIDEQPQNHDSNTKKTVYISNKGYTKKLQNTPIQRLGAIKQQSSSKPNPKQLSTTNQDNFELNQELTFTTLANELEKYKFDDQPNQFEEYLQNKHYNNSLMMSNNNNEKAASKFFDDYSVFEMIQQQ